MDKNLQLLALEYLYHHNDEIQAQVDAIDYLPLHQLIYDDNPKYEWFDHIPEIEELLLKIGISDEQLAQVTLISSEACHVHDMIMPNWDGEGDDFDIKSFDGIEKMINLEHIEFINFPSDENTKSILKLEKLKSIDEYSGLSAAMKQQLQAKGVELG